MAESFGRLLQRHRVAAGLSQEDLAELAGVSTNAISALERGLRHAPHSATLDLLVSALRLDDAARVEIEEAAKLARARRIQAQRYEIDANPSDEVLKNNLPPELTSFVDREKEVPEIKALLQSHRLVTLVGTGGAGKTRCAIRVGRNMLEDFGDGVWLAELARVSDPILVSAVVAQTLKVRETPSRPTLETLLASLKRKHVCLILDNCEHVIDEARRVTSTILHDCPNVRVLATSRESLSIAGEQVYRMPSLLQFSAVQLFSDRAFSAGNRYTLGDETASDVMEICRRLDGIPLAIELAAARVATLSPKQLAQKLDERFRVLTGGDRSALPRHQTMRALIDWSYDLLSDDERWLFRRLSIFTGGFTLGTAAAVCSKGEVDEILVLDLLSSLVDKSLVHAVMGGDDARYSLLESMRQYAREKLNDAGQEEATAHAHAHAFLELAEHLYDTWQFTPDRVWNAQAEPELENFSAALSWAFGACGDALVGQRLAGLLRPMWVFFAPAEGQRWVLKARQRITAETPVATLAMLDSAEASTALVLHQYKTSLTAAERALARYRDVGDQVGVVAAQGGAGWAQVGAGQVAEGEAQLAHALEAARSLGAHRSVIFALHALAFARAFAGDLRGARLRYGEALAAARSLGAEKTAAIIAMNLAEVEFCAGDADAALRLAGEALAVLRPFGDTPNVVTAENDMAAYLVALHRFDEARAVAREALTAGYRAQFSVGVVWALQHLAATAALHPSAGAPVAEDRRRAARILGYADSRLAALESSREYAEQQEYDAMIPALRDALGEDEVARIMALGSTWSEDQAVAEAMLI